MGVQWSQSAKLSKWALQSRLDASIVTIIDCQKTEERYFHNTDSESTTPGISFSNILFKLGLQFFANQYCKDLILEQE